MKIKDRFNLKGQNVIITGAAGKLGFYHALAILEKEGNYILLDKDNIKLINVKRKLEKFLKKIISHKIDLSKKMS